jgi:hypothetical protein
MKWTWTGIVFAALLLPGATATADGWSGSLRLDKRFGVYDWFEHGQFDTPMLDMYNKAQLGYEKWLGEDLQTVVSVQLRFYDQTTATTIDHMTQPERQMEFQFLPWEIFFKAHDLFVEGLDLSVGKQRVAWGKADKLNPTDRINPPDLSDIFDFGARVPSPSAVLSYTFPNDFSFTAVWAPTVQPALLYRPLDLSTMLADPVTIQAQLEAELLAKYPDLQNMSSGSLPTFALDSYDQSFRTPSYDFVNSMQAARFAWSMLDMDFSVSYFHGFESIPVPTNIYLAPDATALTQAMAGKSESGIVPASARVDGQYMETHMVGFDLAGDLAGMGFWAEIAVVFPKAVDSSVFLDAGTLFNAALGHDPAVAVYSYKAVKDEPFVQYTLGLDYVLPHAMYINFQYAHGMMFEIGSENQNDYFILKFDKKFLRDTLRLTLQGGGVIVDWKDIPNQYGYLANPEIGYKPFDNLELMLGAYVLGGKGPGLFALLEQHDQIYLRGEARF